MAIDPLTGREEIMGPFEPNYTDTVAPMGDPETASETQAEGGVEEPGEIQMTGTEGEPVSPFSGDDAHFMEALNETPAPGESLSAGKGQSVGFTGHTEAGKKYAAGVYGNAEKKADADIANMRGEVAGDISALGTARQGQLDVLKQKSAIDDEHFKRRLELHTDYQDYQREQMALEALAHKSAQAEAHKYIAQYQEDMAGVRQLMNTTGNPLPGLNTTAKVGVATSAFLQGLLAVRGINVNVVGQIDKWVDREMQAHQQMINNKTAAANTQLTLYGIAKANAKDDLEARTRLRGFMLDGMKTGIMMEADKYNSSLAKMDAMAKAAELDVLQAQNTVMLHEKVRRDSLDIKKQAMDQAHMQAQDSVESFKASIDADYKRKLMALNQDELDRKYPKGTPEEEAPTPIVDATSNPIDDNGQPLLGQDGKVLDAGENKWVLDEKTDPGVRAFASKTMYNLNSNYNKLKVDLNRLRELKAEAKAKGLFGAKAVDLMTSEEGRRYYNQITETIAKVLKADSGLTVNEGEREVRTAQLSPDKFWQSGNNDKLIEDFSVNSRNAYRSAVRSLEGNGIRRLRPEELGRYSRGDTIDGSGRWSPLTQVDVGGAAADNVRLGDEATASNSPPFLKDAEVAIGSGRRDLGIAGLPGSKAAASFWDKVQYAEKPTKGWSALVRTEQQPEIATKVDDLFRGVLQPNKYREKYPTAGLPTDDRILRGQLYDTLKAIGREAQIPEIRDYANKLVGIGMAKDLTKEQQALIADLFLEE